MQESRGITFKVTEQAVKNRSNMAAEGTLTWINLPCLFLFPRARSSSEQPRARPLFPGGEKSKHSCMLAFHTVHVNLRILLLSGRGYKAWPRCIHPLLTAALRWQSGKSSGRWKREREKEIQNAPFIHVLGKTSGEGREQNHRGNNSLVLSKGVVERRVSCSFETTWKSHSR